MHVPLQEQGPFSERQASLVLYQCLSVIAACHSLNVVHGDVKPANFLLKQRLRNPMPLIEAGSVTDWLKAIDFGCSQEVRGIRFSRRTGTPGRVPLPPYLEYFPMQIWSGPVSLHFARHLPHGQAHTLLTSVAPEFISGL